MVKQDNNGETLVVTTTLMHNIFADENTLNAEITPRQTGASFPSTPNPQSDPKVDPAA